MRGADKHRFDCVDMVQRGENEKTHTTISHGTKLTLSSSRDEGSTRSAAGSWLSWVAGRWTDGF